MLFHRRFATTLLAAALLLPAQPGFALDSSNNAADAAIRELADQAAAHLVRNEMNDVYASMSPKLKSAYSREELVKPAQKMQEIFGRIKSYEFQATNHGKRGVGNEWIRIVTYWYQARTEKHASGTYLKVEVTQEQGRYFIAGYSMERVLFGGKLPFLKQ